MQNTGEETTETVVSDKKRIEAEGEKKPAFVVKTDDAPLFEDFPCNPLGV